MEIAQTRYEASPIKEQLYEVTIPREAHLKADTHTAAVYSGGNLVKEGLLFTLSKETGTINKMGI